MRRPRLTIAFLLLSVGLANPVLSQRILSEGIKDLATQIAANVSKENKQKIAILPFRELDGKPTILGTYISEELVTNLFVIGGLDIVEREMLDRLLGEIRLGQTGVIDPETAKKVGKVAGVDAIVTGSITDLQSYVALNCRLIDAQTGRIFAAAQTKILKDDDVRKIMGSALPASQEGSSEPTPRPSSSAGQRAAGTNKAILQQQAGSLLFELKGCTLAGTSVDCDLLVTNKGEDQEASIPPTTSRLIDAEGNEYHAVETVLGSLRRSVNWLYVRGGGTQLAAGIAVKAQLKFEGIAPEAQRASLLEFRVIAGESDSARRRAEAKGGSTVQFRNVPLVRP